MNKPVDQITVGRRYRKDVGDLSDLLESIPVVGILQPIVIDPSNVLIGGLRRLTAVKQLGMTSIPVHVSKDVVDARQHLKAEQDENTCRLPLKMSEMAELVKAIAKEKGPANKARGHANLKYQPSEIPAGISDDSPSKTHDIVAEQTGLHPRQVDRLTYITKEVDKDNEVAIEVMRKLDLDDGSMSLTGGYEKVRESVGRPIPDRSNPIKSRPISKKSLDIMSAVCGRCEGLQAVPVRTMSSEDALIWYEELGDALMAIKQFRSQLKEKM